MLTLTVLLENIDLFLYYQPNMLALCWHNMPAHYAFYYASIFDGGLLAMAGTQDWWRRFPPFLGC